MPSGRPSEYTEEIGILICQRIADGESLRKICQDEDMPARSTVFRWLVHEAGFSDRYTRARELQADAIFDEILDISDDGRNDYMESVDDEGGVAYKLNGEHIQRSRLRVDARKWMAGKLRPKKYSDKLEVEHSGSIKHNISELSDEELAAIAVGQK